MASKPIRIQRKRTKGWRMPPNTVCVTRPGKWGNPWRVGEKFGGPAGDCAKYFEAWITQTPEGRQLIEEAKKELCGKNLACFCPLTNADGSPHPCHADVLLKLANEDGEP